MKVREGETVNNTKERKKLTKMGGGGRGKKREMKTFAKEKAKTVIFALLIKTEEKQKMDEIGMINDTQRQIK